MTKNDLQDRVIILAGVPQSVQSAMDCWSGWMKRGSVRLGYPSKSSVFATGGISCWDDLGEETEGYLARIVNGAIDSLTDHQRTSIGAIWLGHSIREKLDVEQLAVEAMVPIWRKLQKFGVA